MATLRRLHLVLSTPSQHRRQLDTSTDSWLTAASSLAAALRVQRGQPAVPVHSRSGTGAAHPAPEAPSLATETNLAAALLRTAQTRAAHAAYVTDNSTYSYADLLQATEAVAAALEEDSVFRPGQIVALVGDSSIEYLAGFYGILLAGGVVIPIPADVESDRLRTLLDACHVGVVLTVGEFRARTVEQLGEPTVKVALLEEHQGPDGDRYRAVRAQYRSRPSSRGDLAAIIPTAGSSGEPKLVMLSHGNLLANAESIIRSLGILSTDRALALLPFHHAFGNSIVQTHLLCGATLVRAGSVLFPNSIVEALQRHDITSFSGVPEMYRALLTRSTLGWRPLRWLRYMTVAGGGLAAPLAEQVIQRIAPASFYVMYGQTEAGARLSCLRPEEWSRRRDSIGRGIPGVELQVVDVQGHQVAPGEVGELRARGENVMLGYYGDAATTANVVRDGWLSTGDLAAVDDEGYVYLRGRASQLLKISGYRVHPAEVEAVVARYLAVEHVAVVPCETPTLGTRLALFVQPTPQNRGLTVDEVVKLCQAELPPYKVPVLVEILGRFPLTSALKIDRPALQRRAATKVAA